jgi:hypothetical protein
MPDSEKKNPNHYDSWMDKAKSSWPISLLLISFALLSSARGVMESIDYFSKRIFKKEQLSEELPLQVSLPAAKLDSAKVVPAESVARVSQKEVSLPKKQPSVEPKATTNNNNYDLTQIQSSLSKIFRQRSQASRIELDKTGKVGIMQKNGSYAKFMVQDIRLEWNSNDYTIGVVSDKKSIIWHGISTFADGTRGWNTERIRGVIYSFSKNDFEQIKQLFAQYRKNVTERKK